MTQSLPDKSDHESPPATTQLRPKRRLALRFAIASAIFSGVLLVLLAKSVVLSDDSVLCQFGWLHFIAESQGGHLRLEFNWPAEELIMADNPPTIYIPEDRRDSLTDIHVTYRSTESDGYQPYWIRVPGQNIVFQFAGFAFVTGERWGNQHLSLYLPTAFPAALTLLPLIGLLRAKRKYAGLCPTCHYDVQATPDCCPECGTPIITSTTKLLHPIPEYRTIY